MKNTRILLAILAIVSVVGFTSSQAALISVPNGDFSVGNSTGDFNNYPVGNGTYTYFTSTSIWSNWTATITSPAPVVALGNDDPHGLYANRDAKIYFSSTTTGTTTVYQTLGTLVAPNTTYTLTADLTRWGDRPTPDTLDLRLLVGGVELTGGILSSPALLDSESPNPVSFVTWTKTYQTGGSVPVGALTVQLFASDAVADPIGDLVYFDNITLDAYQIPEPSTMLLLAGGGLLLWRRRS